MIVGALENAHLRAAVVHLSRVLEEVGRVHPGTVRRLKELVWEEAQAEAREMEFKAAQERQKMQGTRKGSVTGRERGMDRSSAGMGEPLAVGLQPDPRWIEAEIAGGSTSGAHDSRPMQDIGDSGSEGDEDGSGARPAGGSAGSGAALAHLGQAARDLAAGGLQVREHGPRDERHGAAVERNTNDGVSVGSLVGGEPMASRGALTAAAGALVRRLHLATHHTAGAMSVGNDAFGDIEELLVDELEDGTRASGGDAGSVDGAAAAAS